MNNNAKIYLSNIFIIDWDDTLFPSTWVSLNNIIMNDTQSVDKYKLYFLELDNTLTTFIESIKKLGEVYIVTNANMKWINTCLCSLNNTKEMLLKHNIQIISARDMYSHTTLTPTEWKIFTFRNILGDIIKNIKSKSTSYLNITSIGDAGYEYIALMNLDSYFKQNNQTVDGYVGYGKSNNSCSNYLLKSIKFIEKPEFNCLIEEIQITGKNIKSIVNQFNYVDLRFES